MVVLDFRAFVVCPQLMRVFLCVKAEIKIVE
jgi:hypothetical protein